MSYVFECAHTLRTVCLRVVRLAIPSSPPPLMDGNARTLALAWGSSVVF